MTSQTPRSRRLARLVLAGLAVGALAAPPAVAGPIIGPVMRDQAAGTTVTVASDPPVDTAPLIVRAADDAFDWGSAAIGAGGAGALLIVASLGGFAYTSRDRDRIGVAQ